jgi:hypothetical protein
LVPVVVIDVMPAGAPAAQAQVMIDACSQAVRRGGCALSSASPESNRPESVALVIWQGDEALHVSIRVSRGDGEWASRQLDFSAADAVDDRWTAVGLTVATLVDETRAANAPPAAEPKPAPPASVTLPPSSSPASTEPDRPSIWPRVALSLGGLAGTGWDDGEWKRGIWASAAASWPRTPVFVVLGTSYAWSDGPELAGAGELATRWYDVSLGIGLAVTVRPLRLRLFAAPEIALQIVTATLSSSGADLQDREARLRLRGGAVWPADGRFGLSLGGAVRVLPTGGGDPAPNRAHTSGIAAELLGGIELRL